MMNPTNYIPRLFAIAATCTPLIILGCSGDEFGSRYSVTGTVTYKDAPVEAGNISFIPKDPEGRGASGKIENGLFSLTTVNPNDGAFPGEYRVVVDARQVDQGKADAAAKEFAAERGLDPGTIQMVPQEVQAKMLAESGSNIPGKYQIPETSDLEAVVKEESNTFEFVLKD